MTTQINKEEEKLKEIKKKYNILKDILRIKEIEEGEVEDRNFIDSENKGKESLVKYKVDTNMIKTRENMAHRQAEESQKILKDAVYLQKLAGDMKQITESQNIKIDTIYDYVEDTKNNTKKTFENLLQAAQSEKNFKDNKCCIMAIILLILVLAMVFTGKFQHVKY